jgi:hypothetical protein
MFYCTGAIFATLKTSFSHVVKSIAVENALSSTSRRKSAMRLRKVRWNIYQKIRLDDKDVKGVLSYYRSHIKRFLKRFSAKMKAREPGIWNLEGKVIENCPRCDKVFERENYSTFHL